MSIEEKSVRSLAELGVTDDAAVRALFQEVQTAIISERDGLAARGASSDAERQTLAKALRDRWLGRKHGMISSIDEHWLKAAPRELKPAVGREFNLLRKLTAELESDSLIP